MSDLWAATWLLLVMPILVLPAALAWEIWPTSLLLLASASAFGLLLARGWILLLCAVADRWVWARRLAGGKGASRRLDVLEEGAWVLHDRIRPWAAPLWNLPSSRALYGRVAGRSSFSSPMDLQVDLPAFLTVGDDCLFGPACRMLAADSNGEGPRPIVLGPGVRIGAHAIVLGGVVIGAGACIGARSVLGRGSEVPAGAVLPPFTRLSEGARWQPEPGAESPSAP